MLEALHEQRHHRPVTEAQQGARALERQLGAVGFGPGQVAQRLDEPRVARRAEGRQSGNDQSQNDIVLRRSFDGGRTWAPHQILHDDGVNALNNPMVVQATTGPNAGRIFVCYQRYPRGTTIWNAATGYTASNIVSCFLMHSDDDGATWAGPFDVTRSMKPPSLARSVNG